MDSVDSIELNSEKLECHRCAHVPAMIFKVIKSFFKDHEFRSENHEAYILKTNSSIPQMANISLVFLTNQFCSLNVGVLGPNLRTLLV